MLSICFIFFLALYMYTYTHIHTLNINNGIYIIAHVALRNWSIVVSRLFLLIKHFSDNHHRTSSCYLSIGFFFYFQLTIHSIDARLSMRWRDNGRLKKLASVTISLKRNPRSSREIRWPDSGLRKTIIEYALIRRGLIHRRFNA